MAASKKKSGAKSNNSAMMAHASDVIGKIWDHWLENLGHTEAAAEKKMKAILKNLHSTETKTKKRKPATKVSAKKAKAPLRRKTKAA